MSATENITSNKNLTKLGFVIFVAVFLAIVLAGLVIEIRFRIVLNSVQKKLEEINKELLGPSIQIAPDNTFE